MDPARAASVGTLAHVDLETLKSTGTHVTIEGVAPCHMRALVRESTPRSFGLALVEPYVRDAWWTPHRDEEDGNMPFTSRDGKTTMSRDEVAAELRATIRRVGMAAQRFGGASYAAGGTAPALRRLWDELPSDVSLLSFKACSLLSLDAKREQSALQCRLPERVRVLRSLLDELEAKYQAYAPPQPAMGGGRSFVAAAVACATPSLVIVEPEGSEAGERAAGFVIYSEDSMSIIVTNRHVANISRPVRIVYEDGESDVMVRAVAQSREYDVAFLRVERGGLPVAALGDSNRCALGDWLIAIGHPAEFDRVVTLGVVSAIQRPQPTRPGVSPRALLDRRATFLATDALYNKGISGAMRAPFMS